jgi:hypothetical protein
MTAFDFEAVIAYSRGNGFIMSLSTSQCLAENALAEIGRSYNVSA